MSIFKEFREFAIKGNVIDLAVGVIIGTAFGKVVTSIVEDMIMPPIGWIIGNINFSDLKLALPSIIEWQKVVTINYGNFLQISLNFLIVAIAVFFLVRVINRIKRAEEKKEAKIEEVKAEIAPDILLLQEIRDLLKTKPTTK
jgi:large conductance mechanosensitive channel